MRHTLIAYALTLLIITVSMPADKPEETPKRKVDFEVRETNFVGGTVLTVNKDSIMIVEPRKPPVNYPFHDRLASGTVQKKANESHSHFVSDIKVGDIVTLGIVDENKQKFCIDLSIYERPGGEIPPTQVVDKERPWYKFRNAEIAFRDKGIPIPEHVKPILNLPPPIPKETPEPMKK